MPMGPTETPDGQCGVSYFELRYQGHALSDLAVMAAAEITDIVHVMIGDDLRRPRSRLGHDPGRPPGNEWEGQGDSRPGDDRPGPA